MGINYLYLLMTIKIILLLFVVKYTHMDFTSPSFITILMFLISTLCIIWNEDYWEVSFLPQTCFVVAGGLLLIVFLELLIKNIYYKKNVWLDKDIYANAVPIYFDTVVKLLFFTMTTLMTAIFVFSVIRAGGVNYGSVFDAISIVHVDDEVSTGILGIICARMMRLITYPCLFFFTFNVFLCGEQLKKNLWLILVILESFIVIFFSGVRSTYLYYIFAGFFYTIMLQRFKNGWRKVDIKKYIKPVIFLGSAFLAIFLGSRTIVKGHDFTSTGLEYITFYLGSPLHLFNKIIDNTTAAFPTNYTNIIGAHTFKWLYQEFYKFGLMDTYIEATNFNYVGGGFYGGGNVYTMFAYTLHDFGYFGMYICILFLYYIFISIYYKRFRYCDYIGGQITRLMVFGSFYHIIFMTFYGILVSQLKLQTIFETIIMIFVFRYLPKIRITRKYK